MPGVKVSVLIATLFLVPLHARAQQRLPVLDMHLHARRAGYIGSNPPPMCTPFAVMPRWDNSRSPEEGFEMHLPPCEAPIPAASTDERVMRETLDAMERYNIIGM